MQKKAWLIDLDQKSSRRITMTLNSQNILSSDGSTYVAGVDLSTNQNIALTELIKGATTSRATVLGATITAFKGGNASMPALTFTSRVSSLSNGENYTNAQAGDLISSGVVGVDALLTTHDKITVTIGGRAVDATITAATGWATGATARDAIADAVIAAWNGKYGTAGTASWAMSVWGTMSADTDGAIPAIALKSSSAGSRGYTSDNGISVKFTPASADTVSTVTSGAATQTVIDWYVGSDQQSTTDNVATSPDIIIQLTASADNDLSTFDITDGTMDATYVTTLTSAAYQYTNSGAGTATTTTLNVYPTDARADVVNPEGASEGTVTTEGVDAVLKTRVHWLG